MIDKWKHLRSGLWANIEPEVELIGLTCPGWTQPDNNGQFAVDATVESINFSGDIMAYSAVDTADIEAQVAQAAAVSSGIEPKDASRLNNHLIKMGHHTPLECVQFNFQISGISKACGAQISRHRIGQGHVSSSRRYQDQEAAFVYPLLENITDENEARVAYSLIQDSYQASYYAYLGAKKLGLKKGDCRYVVPTSSASERIWWINARALRDFFRLRLDKAAEAEIRRLSFMILGIVLKITPTLYDDIVKAYNTDNLVSTVLGPDIMSKIEKEQT